MNGEPAVVPGRLAQLRRRSAARKIIYVGAVIVVAAAVAIIVSLAGGQAKKVAGPPPQAKSFSLAQLGHPGATVTLTAYAGHPVIVNFFASWCAPCQRETPMLARFYASMHGGVTVLGVDSNDQRSAALRFLAKTGVSYPVGFDPYPAKTTTSYGVYALPQTFFLNAQHRIVSHILGPLTMKDLTRGVALMNKKRG
ncbi:MAG TPA: TlpA disulfide reductase family protein [Streptosporangiaceae bacterium]|nr:TlpA disulfide reductase family protein [Streptosporangiaceae bacterium]